ncbi:hypothetical protein SOM55_01685 [Pseudomonas coleopterorum]|uniref:hypothetical protein n=1 Tax=Pseudomonas coleopterorum TaxID=1605838 RepID=UPI002A6A60E4|nr:hypothetical protein [Pseudomonas coleopterorum]MDY1045514.1 hypothetical protein [Pseudomonas coleopterorum]
MTADEFRAAMDDDKSFQARRRVLVIVSLLLLAFVTSGAQIKEANTFIFKIEFTNYDGLKYLLVFSVLACTVRYYSYSERYHNKLFRFWSSKLLHDYNIYHLDHQTGEPSGLLGRKINIYGDRYDVQNPVYRKAGFFRRSVGLKTINLDGHEAGIVLEEHWDLNEYKGGWRRQDLRKLLLAEARYRFQAWFKYRETLDLSSPYLLALSSLVAFGYSYIKPLLIA